MSIGKDLVYFGCCIQRSEQQQKKRTQFKQELKELEHKIKADTEFNVVRPIVPTSTELRICIDQGEIMIQKDTHTLLQSLLYEEQHTDD